MVSGDPSISVIGSDVSGADFDYEAVKVNTEKCYLFLITYNHLDIFEKLFSSIA